MAYFFPCMLPLHLSLHRRRPFRPERHNEYSYLQPPANLTHHSIFWSFLWANREVIMVFLVPEAHLMFETRLGSFPQVIVSLYAGSPRRLLRVLSTKNCSQVRHQRFNTITFITKSAATDEGENMRLLKFWPWPWPLPHPSASITTVVY